MSKVILNSIGKVKFSAYPGFIKKSYKFWLEELEDLRRKFEEFYIYFEEYLI